MAVEKEKDDFLPSEDNQAESCPAPDLKHYHRHCRSRRLFEAAGEGEPRVKNVLSANKKLGGLLKTVKDSPSFTSPWILECWSFFALTGSFRFQRFPCPHFIRSRPSMCRLIGYSKPHSQ